MHRKLIFIFLIIVLNGITNVTSLNLLVTIPQFILVLYYIMSNKMEKAVFWHFLFFITSFTYYGGDETIELFSYNYAKLKFFGPISYSYLISILIFFKVLIKYPRPNNENNLFHQFYKLIIYFMLTGFGVGFIGFIFGQYYLDGLIQYGSYIIIVFIHATILYKMNDTTLKNNIYDIIIPLLVLFPVSIFILNYINPELIGSPAGSFFSMLLFPALLYNKRITFNLVGLFFIVYNSIFLGASGKSLIMLVIFAFVTLYLSFTKNVKQVYPFRSKIIRIATLSFIIAIPAIALFLSQTYGGSSFIVSKMHQVTTLTKFGFSGGGVENIAPSPYVRVTSLINILYEGLYNPFVLMLGKGYGGYFNDHFNFFGHLDLYGGAFSHKAIVNGDFYTGHDTMVTVPMFNGLIGFYLLIKLVIKYVKQSKNNFAALSVIPFLLLAFYFDTLIGVMGVLLLYVSTINVFEEKNRNIGSYEK